MSNQSFQDRRNAAVPRGLANAMPVYVDRAENAELWDVEGNRFIDFAGGIAVLNTGHRHPKIIEAVKAQLDRFTHTCAMVTPYESFVTLAERLNALVPGSTPKKTAFFTTGAEAVENAVKIARAHTGRPGVIAFSGAFHGRTLLAMALTGKVVPYKVGFGPFPAEVYHAPFPNAYRGVSVQDSLKALEQLFKSDVDATRVAAIIVEPVQGEGGFNIAPPEFLQALRKICDDNGILLIIDEIQTGFARTGKMFAIEHSGVEPDLMTMAKSLAGGFPLSAVTGKAEIMDAPIPGGIGGTYAGSPLATTAALAVLDVIEEEKLIQRSNDLGERIAGRFRTMAQRNTLSVIGDVRNLGGMIAMELVKDRGTKEPAAELTKALVAKAAEKGLVLLSCGTYGNVIRILVPLTASDALVDEGLDIIERSLEELVSA
ncbi:4-aminobutyrate--2-oxoglutarate transaminase [Azospirillum brasilense]|uniref:4-aminobutyrate--2-oxoglutarate transaminase n=2 Tax=Azospirillum TaxID=191 RepID=A0A0P0FDK6_AZOBR|nr:MULTISPECIES: 4-aminobutyrate--2-oxoglutarate transaminase [Azospirillum]ALJ37766.1 4-aminobutyrate aminotransferase [Azospirillum brasilense]KAA1055331.1 Gamma-aminobutyrate:alpha-ketoglutarate aminotransferase [Azospirillum argentinense]MBB3266189.1 4-aminobutyrate aminotransferase/(S)-3-amino-2-methylpropionate transaminase [Azospirillum sp. OGB3]MDW7556523.1 4-aminobutyrate--2-oxoglutarate transaminase [Azospirillum brasilense]MDW7592567.1 4-aminobutyrate--2-oxoglutarate transaminase [A